MVEKDQKIRMNINRFCVKNEHFLNNNFCDILRK